MGKRRRYDDQITFPVELPLGIALRAVADKRGVSMATLVRNLVLESIRNDPEISELAEHFSKLSAPDLIKEREHILAHPGWILARENLLETLNAER